MDSSFTAPMSSTPLHFQHHKEICIDGEEWEEEETTTLFEFGKHLAFKNLQDADFQCKLIGIDTPTPFIQIGSSIFKGQLKNALGNDLVFSVSPKVMDSESSSSSSSSASSSYTYTSTPKYDHNHPSHYPQLQLEHVIDQRFQFQKVTLKPKEQ